MISEPSTSSSHLCNRRVALLCCGDFNPPNYSHLRLFERSKDFLQKTLNCQVLEGIICPTSDYNHHGELSASKHRVRMIETAVRRSSWIRCGDYNIRQNGYVRPIALIKYYQKEIHKKYGSDVALLNLCGSDAFETFRNIGSLNDWTDSELYDLLSNHGLVVMKRGKQQQSSSKIIYLMDILRNNQKNIFIIEDETYPSDVSSTRIRRAIRRGESVRYCLDDEVLEYIEEHQLYLNNPICNNIIHDVTTSSAATSSSATTSTSSMKALIQSNQNFDTKKTKSEDFLNDMISPIWKTPPSSKENSHEPEQLSTEPSEPPTIVPVESEKVSRPTMKPILSQPNPAADSPLPNLPSNTVPPAPLRKPSNLPLPPSAINSNNLDATRKYSALAPIDTNLSLSLNFPPPMGSPHYDNVTLDDLLLASTSWAEYLNEQRAQNDKRKKSGLVEVETAPPLTHTSVNSLTKNPNYVNGKGLPKQLSPIKNKEKKSREEQPKERKRSWFPFNNRSKSLKETVPVFTPNSEDDSLIRICGTDRRLQQQTSPELLWRKVKDFGITKERWSEIANCSSRKSSANAVLMNNNSPTKKKSDSRNLRFAQQMAKSAEDLNRIKCFNSINGDLTSKHPDGEGLSRSYYSGMSDECRNVSAKNGVTLTFRRYRLTATPETTV
ncbi:unnamed protein product [Auanema sp. JU1783]|nr:unnamed protein product [Auanema sp. JU1783]